MLFYHHDHVTDFLQNVHGPTNLLLQRILNSMKSDINLSCCRVMGLIAKLITSPFWRIAEGTKHVLDLNDQYVRLYEFLEEKSTEDAPSLLKGESPFDPSLVERDGMLDRLLDGAGVDLTAVQVTRALALSLQQMLKRMVPDQLPRGQYFMKTARLVEETKLVVPHNKLPEFVFGILDHHVKIRPNATVLMKAFVMYSYNKTGQWLQEMEEREREKLIDNARKETMDFKDKFYA